MNNRVIAHPNAAAVDTALGNALAGVSEADNNPTTEEATPVVADAQVAQDAPQDEETQEASADEKPATSGGLDLVQKIIDSKYKGDAQEFVKGLYEQWNSTSKLSRQVEDLEQRLAEIRSTPTQPAEEQDNDIQWLNTRIPAVEYTLQQNVSRQNAIIGELDGLRIDSARLEGRIAATDDETLKDRLERQKDRIDSKKSEREREFFDIKARNFELEKEKFAASRLLNEKQKQYKQPQQQEQQTRPDTKWENNERTDFETSVFDVAVNAGLMPGSEDFDEFMENVKAKAIYEHHKNADQPAVDTVKFAKELATKELKRFQKAAFQGFSEQKAQASGTKLTVPQSAKGVAPAKPSAPKVAPSVPTGKLTLEQAKAHITRVMGG